MAIVFENDEIQLLSERIHAIYRVFCKARRLLYSRGKYTHGPSIVNQTTRKLENLDRVIDEVIPKARHRQRLYQVIPRSAVIDASEDYSKAIEAAREAAKSHKDMELILNAFKDSLPRDLRRVFPSKIVVTAESGEEKDLIKHHFNFDFIQLRPHLPNLGFGNHIPGVGLVQTHRILYASRRHDYDIYLPIPLCDIILAKMESFVDQGKKFSKTVVDLTEKACFPDIRGSFNDGNLDWKDILEIRSKATKFQEWFAMYGGNPDVALTSYGKEFKSSTGLEGYREKIFSIATYATAVAEASIGAYVGGVRGATLGAAVGGMVPFVKELFKASQGQGWRPRFFVNWLHEKQLRKND